MRQYTKKRFITTLMLLSMFLFSAVGTNSWVTVKAAEASNLTVGSTNISNSTVSIKLTNSVIKNDTVTIRLYDKSNNSLKYLNQGNLNNGEITFTAELTPGTYYGYARASSDMSNVNINDFTVPAVNPGNGGDGSTGGDSNTGLPSVDVVNTDTTSVVNAIYTVANNGKVSVDVSANKSVAKEIFDAIKGTDKTIAFKQNEVEWTFNGRDITGTTKTIDMTVSVSPLSTATSSNKAAIGEKVNNENVLVISFANNGQLPGKAQIKVKLDTAWLAGKTTVNIYYYNEATKTIETIVNGLTSDAEGYVVFDITHNSDYIVSDKDLTKLPTPEEPKPATTVRLGGANRYETSVKISQAGWTTSDNVVLARGDEFADALTAAPFAKKLNAPILLTSSKSLDSKVKVELVRLKAKNVYVIGGTGAISAAVENAVKAMGITIERISGSDRYATSLAIANKMTNKKQVFLATGTSYADALSISSYAAATGSPILLTAKNQMTAGVAKFIKDNNSKVYVIGGTGVISEAAVKGVIGVERIAGADRYATNLAALKKFAAGYDFTNIYLATGANYPDAICGSALAGSDKAPIILVNSNATTAQNTYVKTVIEKVKNIKVLGAEGVLSENIINKVIK
jgi:putative cell wall-binding protein